MKESLITILVLFMYILPFKFSSANLIELNRQSVMPENDSYVSVDEINVSPVTKEKFNQILDRIFSLYSPIIAEKGGQFEIERKWEDGTVNAYAWRLGDVWRITMFGGLARHYTITPDGFALVACHELGHHLGGLPKYTHLGSQWATNEGQSDYFGALKCLRRFFSLDDNVKIVKEMEVDPLVQQKCGQVYSEEEEVAICIRSSMAGYSLASLFNVIMHSPRPVRFETPDPGVVDKTYHTHPGSQCRLDTYFQGSLCNKDLDDEVSDQDLNKGVCSRQEGYSIGTRPRCWYAP